jgi:hypothetical protein
MGDLLKDGLAWLTTQLKASASQPVTYVRGSDMIAVYATLGQKLLKLDDGLGGVRMEWTDMDFLIAAADLVLDGQPLIPTRGDTILVTAGESVETYEVLPYGNEPAWRWADPHQSILRIHGKHIDDEPYTL